MDIEILYEDKYIIVIVKPPKIPVQPDKTGDNDITKELLKHIENTEKNPYIGILHRLDRPVGGVMVFAKDKKTEAIMSKDISNNRFEKYYYAITCGKPNIESGRIENYLVKNSKINKSFIVNDENYKGAKKAILDYKVLNTVNDEKYGLLSLVSIKLITGRHHQIRVQLSNAGFPLWGDNKYNEMFNKKGGWTQISLWAYKLKFFHPKTKKIMTFEKKTEIYPFNIF